MGGLVTLQAPDGRGGDTGIDVLADDQRRVYRIKFLIGGSGSHRNDPLQPNPHVFRVGVDLLPPLHEWVLITSKTPTPGVRRSKGGVSTADGLKIRIEEARSRVSRNLNTTHFIRQGVQLGMYSPRFRPATPHGVTPAARTVHVCTTNSGRPTEMSCLI